MHSLRTANSRLAALVALGTTLVSSLNACSRSKSAQIDTTTPAPATATTAATTNPDSTVMLRGTVASISPAEVAIKTDTATVTVKLAQPFHLYMRAPSDMSHVTASSFIGVTTVKQPDGSERATEIHVFPEELRGLGEGSRMMTPSATSGSASRMTNGTAAPAPSTPSRMSNGNVSSTNGSTLVVQYTGGSQTVTVPPSTPVTAFTLSSTPLAVGDQVAIMVTKAADGSLTSSKGLSTKQ